MKREIQVSEKTKRFGFRKNIFHTSECTKQNEKRGAKNMEQPVF